MVCVNSFGTELIFETEPHKAVYSWRDDNFHFKYIVTKVTPNGKSVGIYQFSSDNIDFLKYYKVCSQSEWDSAIDRLNVWFKDASLKIKKL